MIGGVARGNWCSTESLPNVPFAGTDTFFNTDGFHWAKWREARDGERHRVFRREVNTNDDDDRHDVQRFYSNVTALRVVIVVTSLLSLVSIVLSVPRTGLWSSRVAFGCTLLSSFGGWTLLGLGPSLCDHFIDFAALKDEELGEHDRVDYNLESTYWITVAATVLTFSACCCGLAHMHALREYLARKQERRMSRVIEREKHMLKAQTVNAYEPPPVEMTTSQRASDDDGE